jgi:hypothetical protein
MMYTASLPILVPLAVIAIMNRYIVDRFLLARFYRTPQILDDVLHRTSINLFKMPAIVCFFFSWWALGNRQIFDTLVSPRVNTSQNEETHHEAVPRVD